MPTGPSDARPAAMPAVLLSALWLPVAVAVPAFLLLPALLAVAAVFTGWAVTFVVLAAGLDHPPLVGRLALVAAVVAAALVALEVGR